MYVANVGTETLWKMGVSRNIVTSVRNGQVLIFGVATSALLYYFRSGMHLEAKDSVYDIVRFIVGRDEEGGPKEVKESKPENPNSKNKNNYMMIQMLLSAHKNMMDKLKDLPKHEKCPHKDSCAYYSLSGGSKLFGIGLGVQAALKIIMNIQKIAKSPKKLVDVIFSRDTLKIGAFLGGFSFIYRVSEFYSTRFLIRFRFSSLVRLMYLTPHNR